MDNSIGFSSVFVVQLVIEAETPLAVGSGDKGFTIDRLIAKDHAGWPYIPGSSIAGLLRHEISKTPKGKELENSIFGYQDFSKNDGAGSRLIVSSAQIIGGDGKSIMEGIPPAEYIDPMFEIIQNLPVRDHVRINDKGTAEKHGKFDEQIVPKGTRFAFRMELIGDTDASDEMTQLLKCFGPMFRIGSGTRNGFGEIRVVSCKSKKFNLKETKKDLMDYLELSSQLNGNMKTWETVLISDILEEHNQTEWEGYTIKLKPENFFLFGSGHGDEYVDLISKREKIITWVNDTAKIAEYLVIPGSSIKGALSHRTAFYYNKSLLENQNTGIDNIKPGFKPPDIEKLMDELFQGIDLNTANDINELDQLKEMIQAVDFENKLQQSQAWKDYVVSLEEPSENDSDGMMVGEKNEAVKTLFGYALEDKDEARRGNVIISDIFLDKDKGTEKVFTHVAIDRFTGGARDGMLFTQKLVAYDDHIPVKIYVHKTALGDNKIKRAWENALDDLVNGRLQLGGSSMKGHGVFQQ